MASNEPAEVREQDESGAPPSRRRSDDWVAGIVGAVTNLPDGLASAAMAGVNPIYGLYTSMVAPAVGGVLTSTQLMMVATTSAGAIAAGQAIAGYPEDQRGDALFLLVILIGIFQLVAGLLRLGRLTRYVAHSVMVGFLIGVAVLLILDQLAPLVGYAPQGPNEVVQAWDLLRHVSAFDPATMVVGISALLLARVLERTKVGSLASVVALVVPTVLVVLMDWQSVLVVTDTSPIPRGIPLPTLPALSVLSLDLIASALAISVIILVQGAGVGQSFPNRDGTPTDPSRDFIAQGAANIATGFFRGIPAGGSVGQTALNVSLRAQTRWAGVISGVAMLLIVLLIPGVVGLVPMAALAALMILAGVEAINVPTMQAIWNTGWMSRLPLLVTFVATLFFSIPLAVGVGVVLTVLLYLSTSSADVKLYELVEGPDGSFQEQEPPATLPSHAVTLLDVVGSLYFAGARILEQLLPSPDDSEAPVVILRLRGQVRVGATFMTVIDRYSDKLSAVGGKLYLSGVDDEVFAQIQQTHQLDLADAVSVFTATATRGESSAHAYADAMTWTMRPRVPREEIPRQS